MSTMLTYTEFDFIRQFVRARSAITFQDCKQYLVESRLVPLARRGGFSSIADLVSQVRGGKRTDLERAVVEAMTTNETYFFRDVHPFEALKSQILPELAQKRAGERKLNFWCAACSTGQEPYSTAILLHEHFQWLLNWNLDFLATDLSEEVLVRAREGIYSQIEVNRGLPATLLSKYFVPHGNHWAVRDRMRQSVKFRQMNLMGSWSGLPKMDIVFLRNVLIYFNLETKKSILAKVRNVLKPDGYLFLGAAETTVNVDDSFRCIQVGRTMCYQPVRESYPTLPNLPPGKGRIASRTAT